MNDENLVPVKSTSEAREKGRKGGIASGKARREKKTFRELIEKYLNEPATINGERTTRKAVAAVKAAKLITEDKLKPDEFIRALALIRDTLGEAPVTKIEAAMVSEDAINEIDDFLKDE